ncbi:hypothetical protein FKM82_005299 [Ascaphus truei]
MVGPRLILISLVGSQEALQIRHHNGLLRSIVYLGHKIEWTVLPKVQYYTISSVEDVLLADVGKDLGFQTAVFLVPGHEGQLSIT